jgi:hypothetical protein
MNAELFVKLLLGILVGTATGYVAFALGIPSVWAGLIGGVIGALIARIERRQVGLPTV